MILDDLGGRRRFDEISDRFWLAEIERGVGRQREAGCRRNQLRAQRRVEEGLCSDLLGRFARLLRLRTALLVERIIGSDAMIRRRRSGDHTRVSGKGLRRKYALKSCRVRSLRPQRLNRRNVQASRFRARDEIRPQTADRYQDDVRADRRRFRLALLFPRILLLRLSRRGGEQTDEERQSDGERESGRAGERKTEKITVSPVLSLSRSLALSLSRSLALSLSRSLSHGH